jgi:large subunit ribosomal protein L18
MAASRSRRSAREKVHKRIRSRIAGTSVRPRLAIFKSLKHVYAQVIDDRKGSTLASASSLDGEFRSALTSGGNLEAARRVGELIARRAKERGISQVVFDRGGYAYHGKIKALADAARENGLEF